MLDLIQGELRPERLRKILKKIQKGMEILKKVMETKRGRNALEYPALWALLGLLGNYSQELRTRLIAPGILGHLLAPPEIQEIFQMISEMLVFWVPKGRALFQENRIDMNDFSDHVIEAMRNIGLID